MGTCSSQSVKKKSKSKSVARVHQALATTPLWWLQEGGARKAITTSSDGDATDDDAPDNSASACLHQETPVVKRPTPRSTRKRTQKRDAARMMSSGTWKNRPLTSSEFLGLLPMLPTDEEGNVMDVSSAFDDCSLSLADDSPRTQADAYENAETKPSKPRAVVAAKPPEALCPALSGAMVKDFDLNTATPKGTVPSPARFDVLAMSPECGEGGSPDGGFGEARDAEAADKHHLGMNSSGSDKDNSVGHVDEPRRPASDQGNDTPPLSSKNASGADGSAEW
ncbi:hypothetical protein DIPPA_14525 [Diplonema papillatum]|nr:hypothetical protein DIPPA_14525 [Diplonema papillatum]